MLTDIINECQNNINELKNLSTVTYENTIIPVANKILTELNKLDSSSWPRKLNIEKGIDIYTEAITIHMLYTYTKNIKFNYPLHCVIYVLIKHPYFINMIQMDKKYDEWKEYSEQLINEISLLYGDSNSSSNINELKKLLAVDSKLNYNNTSSIHKFHYLIGFHFESETVGITGEELLTKLNNKHLIDKDTIFISINVAHNILNNKSIVIYKNIPKFREKLLNISTIDLFNPFIQPEHIYTPSKEYTILSNELKELNELPKNFSKSYVILCYNDSDKIHKCHYSLAMFSETIHLSTENTKAFIEYKIISSLDSKLFDLNLKEDFYNIIGSEKKNMNDLKKDYVKIMQIAREAFNKSNQQSFIKKFIDMLNTFKLIHEHELPYFKIYLSKIKTISPYNIQNVLNYVSSYIYPDLLINSSSV